MKITINYIITFMKNKQNLIITDKQVKETKTHFYKHETQKHIKTK